MLYLSTKSINMCVSMHEEKNNCVKRNTPGFLAHYVVKYSGSSEDKYLIFKGIMKSKIFSSMTLYSTINLERMVFELSMTFFLVVISKARIWAT